MLIFLAMDSSTLFVTDAKVLVHCFIHRIRIRFGITVLFNHLSYYLLSAPLEWRNRTEVHLLRLRAQLLHPRRPRLCIRALHRLLNVKKSKVIIIIILITNIMLIDLNGRNWTGKTLAFRMKETSLVLMLHHGPMLAMTHGLLSSLPSPFGFSVSKISSYQNSFINCIGSILFSIVKFHLCLSHV